tara:strand:+ start:5130 stop:5897 length:768 start_codon:yes stop_codon:yes gene_type:complete
MVKRIRIMVLLGLLFTGASQAQFLEGDYMPFGLGYAFQTVKDAALSPVSYSGNLGLIQSGYYFQDEKWLSQLDISGFGGFQYPDVNPENNPNRTTLFAGRAHYSLSYKLGEVQQWALLAGILSHNVWDYREVRLYSNSEANFNGMFAAGVQLTAQKQFNWFGDTFGVQYGLGLPIGCYYMRPGYVKPFFADEIAARDLAFWGDYFALDSRTDLYWQVSQSNWLKLTYQWEYTQLDISNKIQTATHLLSVSTIFKF